MFKRNRNPISPEQIAEQEQKKFKHAITRRQLLVGSVALAASYVIADRALASSIWSERKTKVAVLPEHEAKESENLWLVSPGLGVQSSFGIASTLRTSLELAAPVAYMDISDSGLMTYELADALNKLCWERKVKRLKLFGHSIGTILGIELANMTDVSAVDMLLADGSPYDKHDVKDETWAEVVERFTSIYEPGYLSKLGGELINSTIRDPNHNLTFIDQIKDGIRVTGSGVAPEVFSDQLKLLINTNTGGYTNKINEQADTLYIHPSEPEKDRVVDVLQAHRRYNQALYDRMGVLPLETTMHASPTDFPGQYNAGITAYLEMNLRRLSNPRLYDT